MTEHEPPHASESKSKSFPIVTVDPEHPELAEEQMHEVFLSYADQVKDLGIVRGLLIGSKKQEGGFLWNVFAEEVSLHDDRDFTPYENLNDLTYDLEEAMREFMHMRIAHVNPSQLELLKEDCERQNIKTEFVSLIDPESSDEITEQEN